MEREKRKISFTEGSVFGSLIRFSLPVLGALILQAAYGAVDLAVVGLYDGDITAVGIGSSFTQMITYIITSLAMGATVTIGKHVGEGKDREAGNAVGTTIMLFLIIGVALTIILEVFAVDIANLLGAPQSTLDNTVLYIRICSGGVIVIIAYNVIASILRGFGNANLPFVFVCVAFFVNVAGDFLLVGLFRMDVVGAAIATVAAQGVSVIVSLAVLLKKKLPISFSIRQCRIFRAELKKILWVGTPIAIQDTTVQISFLIVMRFANQMSAAQTVFLGRDNVLSSGYSAAQKIIMFINLVPSSVMQSSSAFVSQNVGAGKTDRARKGFFAAMTCGCALGAVLFFLTFFAGEPISYIFTQDEEFVAQSGLYLKGYAAECILSGILFSCCGYLNGSGKSVPVMLQGISAAAVRIVFAYLFSQMAEPSLSYVALSTPLASLYGILFFLVTFAILAALSRKKRGTTNDSSI